MTGSLTIDNTARDTQIAGLPIHYHDAGQGHPVVLLHGSGQGASGWGNFGGNVHTLAQSFRVLVVDQPAFGSSGRPDAGVREDYLTFTARIINGLLEELGVERAHVVGNSLGASVALRLALDHPARAGRLVLLGGGGLSTIVPDPSEGLKVVLGAMMGSAPTASSVEQVLRVLVHDQSLITAALIEERLRIAREAPPGFNLLGMGGGIQALEMWRHLEHVPHPVLLLWGRDDRVMPMDSALFMLKQLPDAQLHVFGHCGHWVQVERREEFNRHVVDFLEHG